MAKGLPKDIIKEFGVSKKAWAEYRKRQGLSKGKSSSNPVKYMTKKKGKGSKSKITIPISIVAGLYAGMIVPIDQAMKGNYKGAAEQLVRNYTGIDPLTNVFTLDRLKVGLIPLLVGAIVHIAAGKLGVNRAIARTGLPVIRI